MARTKSTMVKRFGLPGKKPAASLPLVAGAEPAPAKKPRKDRLRWAREVRHFQGAASAKRNVLPKATLEKYIRATADELSAGASIRFSPGAVRALHAVTQEYGTEMLRDAYKVTMNRNSITMSLGDMQVANGFRRAIENSARYAASAVDN